MQRGTRGVGLVRAVGSGYSMRLFGRFLLLALGAMAAWGCAPSRLHSAADTRAFYTSFFSTERGIIYFIKPIKLSAPAGRCEVDFTFNTREGRIDSLRVNLTVGTMSLLRTADSITLSNALATLTLRSPKLLFTERNEAFFVSRFSGLGDEAQIRPLFQNAQWRIVLHSGHTHVDFETPEKAQRRIRSLRHYLIDAL